MKGIFLCFMLLAAGQDLKRRQVDVRIYLVFGMVAMGSVCIQLAMGETYNLLEHVAAASIGAGLLGLGMLSGGSIGTGDGCFFLVSGLMLRFWENLAMLCYGTLLCGVFCLIYFWWGRMHGWKNIGKQTVPFLPFAALPGIWLAVWGTGGILR